MTSRPPRGRPFVKGMKPDSRLPLNERPPDRIVIVGNSPSMGGCRLGDVIDGYDRIVRLNCFRLDGYEQHVGSLTSDWVMVWGEGVPLWHPPGLQRVWVRTCDRAACWPVVRERSRFFSAVPVMSLGWRITEQVKQIYPEGYRGKEPSTGLLALHLFWTLYGRVVDFCGMGEMHIGGAHYWEPQRRHKYHGVAAENRVLSSMVKMGRARNLMR